VFLIYLFIFYIHDLFTFGSGELNIWQKLGRNGTNVVANFDCSICFSCLFYRATKRNDVDI